MSERYFSPTPSDSDPQTTLEFGISEQVTQVVEYPQSRKEVSRHLRHTDEEVWDLLNTEVHSREQRMQAFLRIMDEFLPTLPSRDHDEEYPEAEELIKNSIDRAYKGVLRILYACRDLKTGKRNRSDNQAEIPVSYERHIEALLDSTGWQADAIWALLTAMRTTRGSDMNLNLRSILFRGADSVLADDIYNPDSIKEGRDTINGIWSGVLAPTYFADALSQQGYSVAIPPNHWDAGGKIDLLYAPHEEVENVDIRNVTAAQVKSHLGDSVPPGTAKLYIIRGNIAQHITEIDDLNNLKGKAIDDIPALIQGVHHMRKYFLDIKQESPGWDTVDMQPLICYAVLSRDDVEMGSDILRPNYIIQERN